MREKPIPRNESIVSMKMLIEIVVSALYITAVCLCIRFVPSIADLFGKAGDFTYLKSALFATFMMAITFNGFNARTEHVNPFENIGRNRNFLLVMLAIFLMQFIFVMLGGNALSVEALDAKTWLICLGLAFIVIPLDMIRKAIMNTKQ